MSRSPLPPQTAASRWPSPSNVFSSPTRQYGIFAKQLSTRASCLLCFCLLNAVLGFLFSHMISHQHISFAIEAAKHVTKNETTGNWTTTWNVNQKADACSNAGWAYLLLAFACLVDGQLWMGSVGSACCHTRQVLRRVVPKDRLALLGYSRKGSDISEDDEMDDSESAQQQHLDNPPPPPLPRRESLFAGGSSSTTTTAVGAARPRVRQSDRGSQSSTASSVAVEASQQRPTTRGREGERWEREMTAFAL